MKRASVVMLVALLTLSSVPLFAQGQQISKARCMSLAHVRGAWVMKIECVEGGGTITSWDEGSYRGTGVFANWSQRDLGSTYQSLVPQDDATVFLQLG
jgi:hypothetical protein